MIFALSAAFVGLVHSLAPGHWLPVVLMAKARRWPLRVAILGAIAAAVGHILLSVFLGILSIWIGSQFLTQYEHEIESYSGLAVSLFGLIYAGIAFFRHSGCHGHTHHGPKPDQRRAPFLFLFSLGLSPCVAVLPVFGAAAAEGSLAMTVSLIAFAIGVLTSLIGATFLASFGLLKLDHPLFEHYGDVITGFGVMIMGIILFLSPHA